jgi:hypothetical protein
MVTISEKLVTPMIHALLLGYLPMLGMRLSTHPGFAAGCGQFFVAHRKPYEAIGGHRAVADSFHDGITLPRAFRAAGHMAAIFDATHTARCPMYNALSGLWWRLAKTELEGLAGPIALPVWTVLLLAGHVLPWVLLLAAGFVPALGSSLAWIALSCAMAGSVAIFLGWRYRHPPLAVLMRPVGVVMLLAIQWHALTRRVTRKPLLWRGRVQPEKASLS